MSTGFILISGVTTVMIIPLFIFSKPIAGLLIDDSSLNHLFILALLSFSFDMTGQAASSWLLICSRSALMAGLGLVRLVIGLSLNIFLILIKGMGVDGYFISILVINIVSCLVFVGIAFRDCGWRFESEIAHTIRDFLSPLIPGSLASWFGRRIEMVLAKSLISLESVGILEMGYKFPTLISILIIEPFMRSWDTRRYEIADEPGAPQKIARMFTHFIFILTWFGLILSVVIKPLLEVMTPPEFHISYRIARVEILTIIFHGAYMHLLFGLAYAKDTATLSKLRIVTSVLKVFLSWLFISRWGIYGASFSSAVIGLLSTVLVFHFSQKKYRLRLEWKIPAIIIAFEFGVFLWLTTWNSETSQAFRFLDGQFLPWIREGLSHTFLGGWKDGKLIGMHAECSSQVADSILKGAMAAATIVLLPIVHSATRQMWLKRVRSWGRQVH